jgi:hypothetical protein
LGGPGHGWPPSGGRPAQAAKVEENPRAIVLAVLDVGLVVAAYFLYPRRDPAVTGAADVLFGM